MNRLTLHQIDPLLPDRGWAPVRWALALALVLVLLAQPLVLPAAALNTEGEADVVSLPLSFVPNVGQTDAQVGFQLHDRGSTIFFTPQAVVLALPSDVVHLQFEGANPAASITGADRLPGTVSYYFGADPDRWHAGIPTYGGVVYEALYPGIDLIYDGKEGQLKSTYVVAPGADPDLIRWHHEGVEGVQVDQSSGDLVVTLSGTTLLERAPIAWQEINGQRVPVSVSYALDGDGNVSFALGSYDRTLPLIIDPVLSYSTFLGGTGFDEADGLALDGDGNIYITGATTSPDFPDADPNKYEGNEDAFVAKLDPTGKVLLYSVYLGGSCDDDPNGIGVDATGNAYIAGDTDSGGQECQQEFPTKNAHQPVYGGGDYDAFAAKFDPDGQLIYSTYLGGGGRDDADAIAVDEVGNAYVVGATTSTLWLDGGQGFGGVMDAFVIKLDPDGDWEYGQYLGGSDGDSAWGVALHGDNAYVAGDAASPDFPMENPYQATYAGAGDIFVAKLTGDGTGLEYSTYLGGSGKDYSYGLAVDGAGQAYVTGQTESSDYPTTAGAYDTVCGSDGACNSGNVNWNYFGGFYTYGDAFVSKLSADGESLLYSTFLGGSGLDKAYDIAVDGDGCAVVTGDTFSPDFPTRRAIHDFRGAPGEPDVFVVKLEADGTTLGYSTYLGGSQADYGTGIALINDTAWVAGFTLSEDFPVTEDALQDTHAGGGADSFLARLDPAVIGGATMSGYLVGMVRSGAGPALVFGLILMGAAVVVARRRLR